MFLLIKLFELLDSIVVSRKYMRDERPPPDEDDDRDEGRGDPHEGRWS